MGCGLWIANPVAVGDIALLIALSGTGSRKVVITGEPQCQSINRRILLLHSFTSWTGLDWTALCLSWAGLVEGGRLSDPNSTTTRVISFVAFRGGYR